MAGEDTPAEHRGLKEPWKPGQSGNPKGRPKGARNKLGEAFIADLYDAWQVRGAEVIERVMNERPQDALKVVASLLPKQVEIKEDAFGDLSDEQLSAILDAARASLAVYREGGGGSEDSGEPEQSGGVSALH